MPFRCLHAGIYPGISCLSSQHHCVPFSPRRPAGYPLTWLQARHHPPPPTHTHTTTHTHTHTHTNAHTHRDKETQIHREIESQKEKQVRLTLTWIKASLSLSSSTSSTMSRISSYGSRNDPRKIAARAQRTEEPFTFVCVSV